MARLLYLTRMRPKSGKHKQVSASGVQVYCAHKAIVKLSQIKPHPRNPNTHPENQIALLAKIITQQGWRNPIVVSDLSGYIIKGHARYQAAKLLKLTDVPIDVQHYDTAQSETADMIADNRIAELAEIQNDVLKDLLQELDTGEMDMDLTGFCQESLEELMTQYFSENAKLEEKKESIAPKRMARVLISVPVDEMIELKKYIDPCLHIKGCEIVQGVI